MTRMPGLGPGRYLLSAACLAFLCDVQKYTMLATAPDTGLPGRRVLTVADLSPTEIGTIVTLAAHLPNWILCARAESDGVDGRITLRRAARTRTRSVCL